MHTIKKYANRKLYHLDRKQYITLERIGELVQAGEPLRVIENESGADITAAILAQVALQTRRTIPATVLTGLIRSGSDTLQQLQRSLRDVLSGGHPIDMALSARLEQLHAAGTIDTAELVRLRGLLLEQPYAPYPDLPTRRDIARLKAEVDRLTELVEILLRQRE